MLKVNTKVLKKMVAKVGKIITNDKMLPITSLLLIEGDKKQLVLRGSDGTNTLEVTTPLASDSTFYAVVNADLFISLISKTTVEEVELSISDEGALNVKGNGDYSLEVSLDDDGGVIKYPEVSFNKRAKNIAKIEANVIKALVKHHKNSLLNDVTVPFLGGYYFDGNGVITTDSLCLTYTDKALFKDATLITANVMDLLTLFDDEFTVKAQDGWYLFTSPTMSLHAYQLDGVENYPVESVQPLIDGGYSNSCKISKDGLLAALDRLTLFVGDYETNDIILAFAKNGLQLGTQSKNSTEVLRYIDAPSKIDDYVCIVDASMLKKHLTTINDMTVVMHFNNPVSVKFVENDVMHIVSLVNEGE